MANNCKVFTPTEYVEELLNAIEYRGNVYGKSVLENSCGTGGILMEIVRRYIISAQKEKKTFIEIKNGLEHDICGIELEREHVEECRKNLDIVAETFGIRKVRWNIIQGNYLKQTLGKKFQYIIGNPPYIVYRDIGEEERKYLRERYEACKNGKFDYYYAFVEKVLWI